MKHIFIATILLASALLVGVYQYLLSFDATWGFVQPAVAMLLTSFATLLIRASWMSVTRE